MQQHLSPNSVVVRSDGFIAAEIDNEIVALNVERGTLYGLNPVGSRIWSLLANPTQVKDICGRLLAEYNVEPKTCERQVLDLLEELRAEGMVTASEDK